MKATRGFTALAALVLANTLLTVSGMLKGPEKVAGTGATLPIVLLTPVTRYYDVTVPGAWNTMHGPAVADAGDPYDDSLSINETIAYAGTNGGGIVYLPAGYYSIGGVTSPTAIPTPNLPVPNGQILMPYDNI